MLRVILSLGKAFIRFVFSIFSMRRFCCKYQMSYLKLYRFTSTFVDGRLSVCYTLYIRERLNAACLSLCLGRERRFMEKDISKKKLEDYNDVFADIFNALLFNGEEILSEVYLTALPTEAFSRGRDKRLRQGNRDVQKADRRSACYHLICGTENQEEVDNTMPQRIMGYDFASYGDQIKCLTSENLENGNSAYVKRIHDEQRLAPVITIVLYWGAKEWKRPRHLYDMLKFPPGLEEKIIPFVADYPMNLIQVAFLPDEVRRRLKSDFRLLAEYAANKNCPEKLKKLLREDSQVIRHPEEFLDALSAVAGDVRYEEIKEQIFERREKEALTMCIVAEELENTGIKKGIEQGIEGLICQLRKFGISENEISVSLQEQFHLSVSAAEKRLRSYPQ